MTTKDSQSVEQTAPAIPLIDPAAFLDCARDAIIVRGLDGGVRYWNRSAERIFGWSSPEALGRCVQDFLCKDPHSIDEALAGVLASGGWHGEVELVAKSGAEVVTESHWTMIFDERTRSRTILMLCTDVTAKRGARQAAGTQANERPASKRPATAGAAPEKEPGTGSVSVQRLENVGAFANGIAHDLNNVLGPIIMAVDLFKLTMKSQRELDLLETVDVSAQRGSEIVKQVLAMTNGASASASDGGAEAAARDDGGKIRRGNGELILLIDDEASVRTITSQTLEAFGYAVIVACDGADGVAKFSGRQSEIAAVITDMVMPVMGGAATISVLMQLDPDVRVIATSGLNLKVAELKAAQNGVKFFLRKPFTTAMLLNALSEVLDPAN